MNVLAFAASNSRTSINQKLANWAANQIPQATVQTLDLNDYELPIYSEEREQQLRTPVEVTDFLAKVRQADLIIIGFAEHNGTYTAAWKNFSDWLSRTERHFFLQKPVLALATSPGGNGAKSVLQQAATSLPFFGGKVLAAVSVPRFNQQFDADNDRLLPGPAHDQIVQALSMMSNTHADEADYA